MPRFCRLSLENLFLGSVGFEELDDLLAAVSTIPNLSRISGFRGLEIGVGEPEKCLIVFCQRNGYLHRDTTRLSAQERRNRSAMRSGCQPK
jgi:hypothetical protein